MRLAVFGASWRTGRPLVEQALAQGHEVRAPSWTGPSVRGPRFTDGPRKGEYRVGYIGKNSGTQISRAGLAEFMLCQIEDDAFLRQMLVVSY